jgi:hypothetical protein
LAARGVLLFTLTILIALPFLTLVLLLPTTILFETLSVLTLANAVAVLFPALILVCSPLILIALHTHANFTRR